MRYHVLVILSSPFCLRAIVFWSLLFFGEDEFLLTRTGDIARIEDCSSRHGRLLPSFARGRTLFYTGIRMNILMLWILHVNYP